MAPRQTKNNDFLIQGSILAIAGILVRVIGMIYRIPFIRIVGDEGNGYYSVAFEIYNIVLLISSYAFPTAISKLISARIAKDDYENAHRTFKVGMLLATVIGAAACAFVLITAGWFADSFFMLPLCRYAILSLAPTVWIMAYLGVMRGFFQGQSTMVPTAISQILEQVLNAFVSVGAAWYFYSSVLRSAQDESMAAAKGAMGGTIGTGAGALTALIVLIILYFRRRSDWKAKLEISDISGEAVLENKEIGKIIILTLIPIVLSQVVYNINVIIDSRIFSAAMIGHFGFDAPEVAKLYGSFTGRFKTLINVPVAISNALGLSLIPALSAAVAANDKNAVQSGIANAMKYIAIISMPAAIGLSVLGGPIVTLLFGKSDVASNMMLIGSFAVLFTSISTVTNSVLQGSNNLNKPVIHSVISLIIHIASLIFMLYVLKLGVYSLVISNIVFGLSMTILNAISIRRKLGYRQEFVQTFIKPFFCALVMGAAAYGVRFAIETFITKSSLVVTAVCVLAAVIVYAAMILVTKTLSKEELKRFPVIKKFIR